MNEPQVSTVSMSLQYQYKSQNLIAGSRCVQFICETHQLKTRAHVARIEMRI